MISFLKELNSAGNTIILVTHDNSIAAQAKRVIRMADGKLIYDGEPMGDGLIRKSVGENS